MIYIYNIVSEDVGATGVTAGVTAGVAARVPVGVPAGASMVASESRLARTMFVSSA